MDNLDALVARLRAGQGLGYQNTRLPLEAADAIRELRAELKDCEQLLFKVREEADTLQNDKAQLEADIRGMDKWNIELRASLAAVEKERDYCLEHARGLHKGTGMSSCPACPSPAGAALAARSVDRGTACTAPEPVKE